MLGRIILFFIFVYLFFKASRFVKRMFAQVNSNNDEPKVHQRKNSKPKISDKDIIDAKFEELPPEDNSTSSRLK